jgi:hypothetical protein
METLTKRDVFNQVILAALAIKAIEFGIGLITHVLHLIS